jgi:outer membrane protein assembly factor BamE
MLMQKIIITAVLTALLAIVGCSAHRIDIQQGNVLTKAKVDALKLGMEKRQVRFVLGSPLLQDPFHDERWDYYYSFTPGGGKTQRYDLTLHFKGQQLARIETHGTIPKEDPVQTYKFEPESDL